MVCVCVCVYVCVCVGRGCIRLCDVTKRDADNLIPVFPPRSDETMMQHDSETADVCACVCVCVCVCVCERERERCKLPVKDRETHAHIKSSNPSLENITEQEGGRKLLRPRNRGVEAGV